MQRVVWVGVLLGACASPSQLPNAPVAPTGETTTTSVTSTTTTTTTEVPADCLTPPPAPEYALISPERIATYMPAALDQCVWPDGGAPACNSFGPSLGDLDGDGRIEVLWNGFFDGDRVYPIDEIVPAETGQPAHLVSNPELDSLGALLEDAYPEMANVLDRPVGLAGIVDVDGDGDKDIMLSVPWGGESLLALLQDQGTFSPLLLPPLSGGLQYGFDNIELHDWDNDGRLDLASLMQEPMSPELADGPYNTNVMIQQDDGSYQSVHWLVHEQGLRLKRADQLGVVDVDGRPFYMATGNPVGEVFSHHPMLFSFDTEADPEGFPVATSISSSTPSASDGVQMGGGMMQFIDDTGPQRQWSTMFVRTCSFDYLMTAVPYDDELWVDTSEVESLYVSPNNYQSATGNPQSVSAYQLPWHVTTLDDYTFAVANGDDAGSGRTIDGQPIEQSFYFGHSQTVDFFQLDAAGRYQSITEQVRVDGVAGRVGQPGGSYLGFSERGGYAVWLASWIDDTNPEGFTMRSWLADRLHPEGHHWATFAPVGTTSNLPAIGTEVYFTTEPSCGDELEQLLLDDSPYDDLASACGGCGYTRLIVGEHDAGSMSTSPEVEFYMGESVADAPPVGTALLRYPSGTVQRVDDVSPGLHNPVEPETVTVTTVDRVSVIVFQPVDANGTPVPIASFNADQVDIRGVPVSYDVVLTAAGVAEITITAPSAEDLAAWELAHPLSTVSTQVRLDGSEQRPRLFWR